MIKLKKLFCNCIFVGNKLIMRKYFLFFLIVAINLQLTAQENQLHLKSGITYLNSDLQINTPNYLNYCFISFSVIPTTAIKNKLEESGVEFLEYIPKNTFVVSLPKNTNTSELAIYGVNAISLIKRKHKIDPKIQNYSFPECAINNGKLLVKVLLYKNTNLSIAQELFKRFFV